ncbi:histone deacetylase family protein [Pseudooceanicola sp. MF1-13]|uniref:histone deacetylase family protein n=1 Tax=Pseudooceanicola sp. MF1-13 TaxID=3379095 RepID=UPI003891E73A
MKCFYAKSTEAHDPQFRLSLGRIARNAEQAERARLLLAGLDRLGWDATEPEPVPREVLEKVHTQELLNFLETGWAEWQALPEAGPEVVPNVHALNRVRSYPKHIIGRAGWHMGDTSAPLAQHSWQATLGAASAAHDAARAVAQGYSVAYALCRPPGHHSSADVIAGHCMMNCAAIAVETLKPTHDRIAVLDIDVHHGNGTQDIFYDRDDVLFASVHATPETYYPFFVGHAHETGSGAGDGYNLNIPLAQSTGDDGWTDAIATALDRVQSFKPDALVVSLGLDAHENDPLKGLQVTFDGFRRAGQMIAAAGLPTVLVQEGGYLSPDLTTSLVAYMAGHAGLDIDI